MATAAGILASIAAIVTGAVYFFKKFGTTPAQTDHEIVTQVQQQEQKAEDTGRPV